MKRLLMQIDFLSDSLINANDNNSSQTVCTDGSEPFVSMNNVGARSFQQHKNIVYGRNTSATQPIRRNNTVDIGGVYQCGTVGTTSDRAGQNHAQKVIYTKYGLYGVHNNSNASRENNDFTSYDFNSEQFGDQSVVSMPLEISQKFLKSKEQLADELKTAEEWEHPLLQWLGANYLAELANLWDLDKQNKQGHWLNVYLYHRQRLK